MITIFDVALRVNKCSFFSEVHLKNVMANANLVKGNSDILPILEDNAVA